MNKLRKLYKNLILTLARPFTATVGTTTTLSYEKIEQMPAKNTTKLIEESIAGQLGKSLLQDPRMIEIDYKADDINKTGTWSMEITIILND